ncbi:MAG: Beta-hexosaminidase [Chlamydiales bacterium]|nr:Beta-hexosaminidase [Chlamydiales bacterium]MCH9619650.1 Beta-hexosaminidase [Chlamydiales bacterium]MCH9623256.1 Beta-hexosaminidase [Chlamydiales bacterium]
MGLLRKITFIVTALFTLFSTLQASLTIEEQIGQILIPYIDGEKADETTYKFLATHRPGGVIFYNWSNKLESPQQTEALAFGLQMQAADLEIPSLFISTDQEGGLVTRLYNGFTEFPGNAALGRADSVELAFLSAKEMGLEMKEVGINFTFAPVVDVHSNRNNPVIGIRSYGDNPALVTRLGLAASYGFSAAGIVSCLKHFPGHGDVEMDSHESLPTLKKCRDDLDALEFVSFRTILNESPAIMTAHLRVPELDHDCCTSLSKAIVTHLLRNEWGYQGLIVTDSLTMGAIVEECGDIAEAAVQAFEAGSDLLVIGDQRLNSTEKPLLSRDLSCIRNALLKALYEGRITIQRLEESVDRILRVKKQFHIGEKTAVKGDKQLACECSYEIAKRAVRLEKGSYFLQRRDQNVGIIAPRILQRAIETSGFAKLGGENIFYFNGLNPTYEEIKELEEKLIDIDSIIFTSYNAWRFKGQKTLLSELSKKFRLTLLATRDARDGELGLNAETIITTVSPTAVAFQVVYEQFFQASMKQIDEKEQSLQAFHRKSA